MRIFRFDKRRSFFTICGTLKTERTKPDLTARLHDTAPVYVLSDSGPDHDKRFFATVIVAGQSVGYGEGRSKKTAEQAAAEQAWVSLSDDGDPNDSNSNDSDSNDGRG